MALLLRLSNKAKEIKSIWERTLIFLLTYHIIPWESGEISEMKIQLI